MFPSTCSVWLKNLPSMQDTQEMWIQSLGWEDPLEESMATHSGILAWRITVDRAAWRATVHGVAKSWEQLKWLSSLTRVGSQHTAAFIILEIDSGSKWVPELMMDNRRVFWRDSYIRRNEWWYLFRAYCIHSLRTFHIDFMSYLLLTITLRYRY